MRNGIRDAHFHGDAMTAQSNQGSDTPTPACYATFRDGKMDYSEFCVSENLGDFDVSELDADVDIVPLYSEETVSELLAALTAEREKNAEATETLQFVERWANHHGQKECISPAEALSCIQHYPPILAITRGYADGKIPETPNPWALLEAEREKNAKLLSEATSYSSRVTELENEVADLRDGNELFDALVNCARIRVMGSAGLGELGELKAEDNYVHIGVELWTKHNATTTDYSRAAFISFAQAARAIRAMKEKQ